MTRTFNFSAGPAALPDEVLARIRDDIPDWQRGMSVMEVSHRSKEFIAVAEKAERDVRDLLSVPDDYHVLFLQGGATMQFAMTPLNLSGPDDPADYVQTGSWSKKAAGEARKFCNVSLAADSQDAFAVGRYRLRPGLLRIAGPDPRTSDDERGRGLRRLWLARSQAGNHANSDEEFCQPCGQADSGQR